MAMDFITADENGLRAFFGQAPKKLEAAMPWCFDDLVYEYEAGPLTLSFAVAPFQKDVRLILKYRGVTYYELNGVGVEDVVLRCERSVETLDIELDDGECTRLRLKPNVSVCCRKDDGENIG